MNRKGMTNRQVLQEGKERLCQAEVPEGEWDAWLLFSAAYGMDRKDYLMKAEETADPECGARYEAFLKERLRRRPTAYILESRGFMGLDFFVNENVLVPRQDTETLVEGAIKKMGGRAGRVLDLCTGSGCIAVSIAKYMQKADIWAADISEKALAVAGQNACLNKVSIKFLQGDLFQALPAEAEESFDMILSNPPYIAPSEYDTLEPEVTEFEPVLALKAEHEGMIFYERISAEALRWLKPGGILGMEIGCDQRERVIELLAGAGYVEITTESDMNGLDRVVWCRTAAL